MTQFLLVNPRSGDQRPSADELGAEAWRLGIEVYVLQQGEDPQIIARRGAEDGAEALGMAGGDGSLGAVAAVALERGVPFVCIPFGTRNHFARDLGLDRDDPLGGLAAFRGAERRVDVGSVDSRVFLNNVSLGVYASFVHDPRRKTRNRLTAFLRMAPAALGRSRQALDLSFDIDSRHEHHAALVLLVANNDYKLESMADAGERESLEEGLLHAYVIEVVSRRALLGLLARAAIGRLGDGQGLVEHSASRFRVEALGPRVHAAVDGEPALLASPLQFEIRPRALRVLLPTA